MRPVRDLAEAMLAGELLRTLAEQDQSTSPAYLEHLRDVGPRMTRAELLVAVDGAEQVLGVGDVCPRRHAVRPGQRRR